MYKYNPAYSDSAKSLENSVPSWYDSKVIDKIGAVATLVNHTFKVYGKILYLICEVYK
ncbi:MAG: hypothetical protein ACHQIM_15280 [Sphingobacteriales bacterium]